MAQYCYDCYVPGPHKLEYNPGGKARPQRGTFFFLWKSREIYQF